MASVAALLLAPKTGDLPPAHSAYTLRRVPSIDMEPAAEQPGFLVNLDDASRFIRAGVVVINERGDIRYQNHRAMLMMTAESVLTVRQGRLYIDRASVQRSLEGLLQRAVSASLNGEGCREILSIPDRSGVVRFALRIVGVSRRQEHSEILVSIVDLIDDTGPCRSTCSAVFRLSVRESELAELFSKGFSLEEISTLMGVALNTARVHLRRIFLKTNCSGQISLMRLLSRLSAIDQGPMDCGSAEPSPLQGPAGSSRP